MIFLRRRDSRAALRFCSRRTSRALDMVTVGVGAGVVVGAGTDGTGAGVGVS